MINKIFICLVLALAATTALAKAGFPAVSLVDQAALTGVLNTLYELHLPVVSVGCVDRNGSSLLASDEETTSS